MKRSAEPRNIIPHENVVIHMYLIHILQISDPFLVRLYMMGQCCIYIMLRESGVGGGGCSSLLVVVAVCCVFVEQSREGGCDLGMGKSLKSILF